MSERASMKKHVYETRGHISELWSDAHGLIGSVVIEPEVALTIVNVFRARLREIDRRLIEVIDELDYPGQMGRPATPPASETPNPAHPTDDNRRE